MKEGCHGKREETPDLDLWIDQHKPFLWPGIEWQLNLDSNCLEARVGDP